MRFGYSENFCPWLYLKLHNVVSSYEIHDEFKRLPSPITCKTMLLISQKCYLFGKECALAKKSLHHFGHQTSWKPSKQTSWDSSVGVTLWPFSSWYITFFFAANAIGKSAKSIKKPICFQHPSVLLAFAW